MKKKQSSIDKFVQQLKRKGLLITEDSEYIVAYLEAKAMHKEEMKEMYLKGIKNYDPKFGGYTGVIGVDNISWTNTNKLNNGGNNE